MHDVPDACVAALYRYPVKGLSPERLTEVPVTAGETLPGDRLYAIENGPGKFDPANPRHLPKINFLMLMRNARLATFDTKFDMDSHRLDLSRSGQRLTHGCLASTEGRAAIEAFLATELSTDLRGAPKIVQASGHSFSGVKEKCIHIVSLASLRALETVTGAKLNPLRFRPNVILDDTQPWREFEWVGRRAMLGDVALNIFKRTERCAAVNVDPETGARDMDLPNQLRKTYGHSDFGIYAMIEGSGRLREGDRLIVT